MIINVGCSCGAVVITVTAAPATAAAAGDAMGSADGRRPLCVRRIGRGTERRPCLWRMKLGGIFDAWGGWKAWAIGDRAVHINGSARYYSINTPQLTLVRLGGG